VLKIVFALNRKADLMTPTAYDLYLQARQLGTEAFPYPSIGVESVALLEQAVETEPSFARAWAELARARARLLRYGDPGLPYADTQAKVTEAVETALRLDPSLGVAYQALAELEAFGDYAEREALLRKGLAAAPDDPAVLSLVGGFVAGVGRVREALAYSGRAFDLDPMQFWVAYGRAYILDFAGDRASLPLWESFCDVWPDSEMVFSATWSAALHGDWDLFGDLSVRERQIPEEARQERARGHRWLGRSIRHGADPHSLGVALQKCREDLERTGSVSIELLTILYDLGLPEEVFDLIEEASFSYMFDPRRSWAGGSPNAGLIFSAIHNGRMTADPRFPRLCAKMGLCRYWVDTDRWPDCADAVSYDFRGECRRLAA
jgi:tetratricopeptide (TPR) repeat protein